MERINMQHFISIIQRMSFSSLLLCAHFQVARHSLCHRMTDCYKHVEEVGVNHQSQERGNVMLGCCQTVPLCSSTGRRRR